MRIPRLPHWVLTDLHPAFYDTESDTAIKMVAKLYAKMQELVDDYNVYIDNVNNLIEAFTSGMNNDMNSFKLEMRTLYQEFIDVIDIKVANQDKEIQDAINFMKQNLANSITTLINQMRESGELDQAILNAIESSMLVTVSLDENENLYITNALMDVVLYDEPSESITIVEGNFGGKEDRANKVTTITSKSTDTEYPSAKAVYDIVNTTIDEEISSALGGEY